MEKIVFPDIIVYLSSELPSAIITSFGFTLYVLILLSALYVEDFIFFKLRYEKITKIASSRKDFV